MICVGTISHRAPGRVTTSSLAQGGTRSVFVGQSGTPPGAVVNGQNKLTLMWILGVNLYAPITHQ